MTDYSALRVAIAVMLTPTRIRLARTSELPAGIHLVLSIAAGDQAAALHAAEALERPLTVVQSAAAFFIEQILLAPDSDSYRTLGVTADASPILLRRNMALLLRGLHPDLHESDTHAALVARVTTAWNHLKTPDLRASHDTMVASSNKGPQQPLFRKQPSNQRVERIGRTPSLADVRTRVPSGFKARPIQRVGFFKWILLKLFGQTKSHETRL